jgi:hypothetical protein
MVTVQDFEFGYFVGKVMEKLSLLSLMQAFETLCPNGCVDVPQPPPDSGWVVAASTTEGISRTEPTIAVAARYATVMRL